MVRKFCGLGSLWSLCSAICMMSKTYIHPRLGELIVRKSRLSKRVRLAVHLINGISVTVPWLVSYSRAIAFVEEKEEWIAATLLKQSKKRNEKAVRIAPDQPLKLITGEIPYDRLKRASADGIISEEAIVKIIRSEAKKYLPQRVEVLAAKYGFKPGKVTVRNNRTNWGCCSKAGNISLNIHLMRLTPELADFVIVHELCHLIHKNHGPQFHALLNSLCNGREKELNIMLKQQRPQVLFVISF